MLWISKELGLVVVMVRTYGYFIRSLEKNTTMCEVRRKIMDLYSRIRKGALEGRKLIWELCDKKHKDKDPYCYPNFVHALSRIPTYVNFIKCFGTKWLGLKF